jgi:hypothetical protein
MASSKCQPRSEGPFPFRDYFASIMALCGQRWATSWYSLKKNFIQQSSVPDASECHCVFVASHSFPPCVDTDEPRFTSSISTSRTA